MEQTVNRPVAPPDRSYTSVHNYIYWSTLIGVFSGMLRVQIPFYLLLFYLIMLINFLLMPLIVNFARIAAWIPCFILYLAASGGIGIVFGTDTIAQVAKEFLGISVSVVYFYYFFKMIEDDVERAFSTYARIAFWFTIVAFPIWAGSCIYFHRFERLRGLTEEPTAFCILVLPAYYWYSYQYFTSRRFGTRVAVFTLAIILSESSNGYLAVAFGAVLLLSRRMKHLVFVPVVVGGLLGLAYSASADFRLRADDTLLALFTQDVSQSNYSTYALMSNLFVTQQVLKESPVIGNGLGSHVSSHQRFIGDVPGVERFLTDSADLNATEAASLALRTLSELGILGFSGVLIFLFYFYVGGNGPRAALSNALLVCFSLKVLRDGNYFGPEQFFFIFIYMLNHRQHKLEVRSIALSPSPRLSIAPSRT
jgi:hypothetical protein